MSARIAMLPSSIARRVVRTSGGCWEWQGPVNAKGYAQVRIDGKLLRAHRVAYAALVGPIPDGHQLDHLCHTRAKSCPAGPCAHRRCVNPAHLEPVSALVNVLRSVPATKAHCLRGHPLSGANLRIRTRPGGRTARVCKTCAVIRANPDRTRVAS